MSHSIIICIFEHLKNLSASYVDRLPLSPKYVFVNGNDKNARFQETEFGLIFK